MKKLMSAFIAIALISMITLTFTSSVLAKPDKNSNKIREQSIFKYTVSNSKATIVEVTFDVNELVIPYKLGGYVVTGIGKNIFAHVPGPIDLVISKDVNKIETGAFVNSRFWHITLSDQNNFFSSVNDVLYNKNQTELILFPAEKQGNIEIKKGVKVIAPLAFAQCNQIYTITIPEGVTSIGYEAFGSCTNLQRVIIPESVKSIGDNAFANCTRLVDVSFLGNAPKMSKNIFSNMNSGFSVSYVKGKTGFTNTWPGIKTNSYTEISTFIVPYWLASNVIVVLVFILLVILLIAYLHKKRHDMFVNGKIENWNHEYDISLWKFLSNDINKTAAGTAFYANIGAHGFKITQGGSF